MRYLILLIALLVASPGWGATIVAGRTTGVAPLMVHIYDSDATASTTESQIFHTRDYSWGFDDSSSGTWGMSGKSKNTSKGPVAAHVYETPGTYTITLTVKDSSGTTVGTDTETIVVSDPDTIYAGTLTTCLNKVGDADFTGCPSGAAHINNDDLTASAVTSSVQDGERLLFKRGSSWTVATLPNWPDSNGPVTIGAYGSCISPNTQGICSNAPEITTSAGFIELDDKQDWRMMDLHIIGSAMGGNGLDDFWQWTFLRLRVDGDDRAYVSLAWGHWNDSTPTTISQMAVIDCELFHGSAQNLYVGSENLAVIGSDIYDAGTSHSARIWQSYRGVVQHNRMSGASYLVSNPESGGRHALKFHSPDIVEEDAELCTPASGTACLANKSELSVISDNTFGGSGATPVMMAPQSIVADGFPSDIIFERNRVSRDYGTQQRNVGISVTVVGDYITVRNNIIDGSNSNDDWCGIFVERYAGFVDTPTGNTVYNNTIYRSDTANDTNIGVHVGPGAVGTRVINNYGSFSETTGTKTTVLNEGTNSVVSNNTMVASPFFVDPDNATPLFRDFALTSGSTEAIDQGTAVALLDDFLGNSRPYNTTYDIGAYEYGATGDPTCFDGVMNGTETGVDCGGSCSACGGGGAFTVIGAGTTAIGAGTTAITP